jgi:hypothetical protein
MLVGSASVEQLAERAPQVESFRAEELVLQQVTVLQLAAELPNSAREAVLPPALHPTVPAAMSLQVLTAQDSPWGEMSLATLRISCRSGVRARGFSVAAIASANACEGLAAELGYPVASGRVALRHGYDGADFSVQTQEAEIAALTAVDPEPMGANDVQFTGTLNLAHTPLGLRMLQIESSCQPVQVERLTPGHLAFDPEGWHAPLVEPKLVISCSVVAASQWTFAPVRFVCKTDELAFTGTESVA